MPLYMYTQLHNVQSFFKPNCSHIYFLLGCRCENYAITLLEQCENLEEVENFLQTKPCEGTTNTNYILAILDSRKKFVAHERFQYVLLKNFGETDLPVSLCLQLLIMTSFWVFLGVLKRGLQVIVSVSISSKE